MQTAIRKFSNTEEYGMQPTLNQHS